MYSAVGYLDKSNESRIYKYEQARYPCKLNEENVKKLNLHLIESDSELTLFSICCLSNSERLKFIRSCELGFVFNILKMCINGKIQEIASKCQAVSNALIKDANDIAFENDAATINNSSLFIVNDGKILKSKLYLRVHEFGTEILWLLPKSKIRDGSLTNVKLTIRIRFFNQNPRNLEVTDIIRLSSKTKEFVKHNYQDFFGKRIWAAQEFSQKKIAPETFATVLYQGKKSKKLMMFQERYTSDLLEFMLSAELSNTIKNPSLDEDASINSESDEDSVDNSDEGYLEELFKTQVLLLTNAAHKLAEFNKENYAHIDVKLQNFVYRESDCEVKLIDFEGCRKTCGETSESWRVSPTNLSPEFVEAILNNTKNHLDLKGLDSFAFGLIAYRMIYNKQHRWEGFLLQHPPVNTSTYKNILNEAKTFLVPEENARLNAFDIIIYGLINPDPLQRWSIERAAIELEKNYIQLCDDTSSSTTTKQITLSN